MNGKKRKRRFGRDGERAGLAAGDCPACETKHFGESRLRVPKRGAAALIFGGGHA